jgi:hypothetical protein
MFSAGPHDAAVEEQFRDVFSVGSCDVTTEGLLGEVFRMWSMQRCYKQEVTAI